jgi:hypothetical protein
MNNKHARNIFGVMMLFFSIIACSINLGGPDYPEGTVPITTQAMGDLQLLVETSVAESTASGQVTIQITESQLTSYLYYKLLEQPDPIITNPQVLLRDGQMQVFGTATQGNFQVTTRIIFSAGVNEQGEMKVELISADFGPLPVPDGLMELVNSTFEEAFTGAFGPVATGIRLLSISISDGLMVLTGEIR